MDDLFSSDGVLVGDETASISSRAQTGRVLSGLFKIILSPPSCPGDLSLSPEQALEKFRSGPGKDWWRTWNRLADLSLHEYLSIVVKLPEVFVGIPWISKQARGSSPYRSLRASYQAIALWMRYLTYGNTELDPRWADYRAFGLEAAAFRNLCIAVYENKSYDSPLHGGRGLFTSPDHVWFWCMVSRCIRSLRSHGLVSPLLSTQLVSKETMLADDRDWIEQLKSRTAVVFQSMPTWDYFIEHVDYCVSGDALKGYYNENAGSDAFDAWVRALEHERNFVMRSKRCQIYVLYRFPEDQTVRTFVSGSGVKLPKPRRRRKRAV